MTKAKTKIETTKIGTSTDYEIDTIDEDCDKCDATAQRMTCDGCNATAVITNCGHFAQPRPIAADGHRTLCDDCC